MAHDENGVSYGSHKSHTSDDFLKVGVSALVGYGVGRWQDSNRNRNGEPGGNGQPAPYGGRNNHCGDDQFVTRFELEQEDKLTAERAKVAKLEARAESKDYTNEAILNLRKEFMSINEKQDLITADLIGKAGETKTALAVNAERLKSLNKEICDVARETNEAFARERAYNADQYVAQPRVKICCSSATITCADSTAA